MGLADAVVYFWFRENRRPETTRFGSLEISKSTIRPYYIVVAIHNGSPVTAHFCTSSQTWAIEMLEDAE